MRARAQAAKRETAAKAKKKKSAAADEPGAAGGQAAASVETLLDSWDSTALIDQLATIEATFPKEHVQLLKLAEYMEERLLHVDFDWAAIVGEPANFSGLSTVRHCLSLFVDPGRGGVI